jgi:hypothetical protein
MRAPNHRQLAVAIISFALLMPRVVELLRFLPTVRAERAAHADAAVVAEAGLLARSSAHNGVDTDDGRAFG